MLEERRMDPQNTFRPIREGADHLAPAYYSREGADHLAPSHHGMVGTSITSPVHPCPLSPACRPGPKLSKGWRQGSETWSSTGGSRQSSRPGSSVQAGSRPPSTHLYCMSGNSSNSDVSVARNFQQLSVSTRRAAFKTQKWSHSFDQTCTNSSPSAPKRRQTSFQQKSLDLDSGYIGSPASGLVSSQCHSTVEPTQPQATDQGRQIEQARRELADLISSQDPINRSISLPSFSQSFHTGSLQENMQELFHHHPCPEPIPAQEELDALDEEIKQIVGDIRCPDNNTISAQILSTQLSRECLKPTPIRSVAMAISPTRCVTNQVVESTHQGDCAVRVGVTSPSGYSAKVYSDVVLETFVRNSEEENCSTPNRLNIEVMENEPSEMDHFEGHIHMTMVPQPNDLNPENSCENILRTMLTTSKDLMEASSDIKDTQFIPKREYYDSEERDSFSNLPFERLIKDIGESNGFSSNPLGSSPETALGFMEDGLEADASHQQIMLAVVRTVSQKYSTPKLETEGRKVSSPDKQTVMKGQVQVRIDIAPPRDLEGPSEPPGRGGAPAFIFKPTSQFSGQCLLCFNIVSF